MDVVSAQEVERRLKKVLPLVAEQADRANETRRPSSEVASALAAEGLLRLIVPQIYGGLEVHPRAFLHFTEQLAYVDGSTAWAMMTCNEEAGIASAYIEPETMEGLFVDNPSAVVAGSGVPKGRAEAVEGGWRITGRWDFVSGCTASDYVVLASIVADSDPVRLCHCLVPTAEVTIEDTWHTAGLRGTGSHDVVLDQHMVDARWAGESEIYALPRPDRPFYRLPSGLRFPFPKVGVAAGLARAAIDEFRDLAEGKRPLNNRGSLRERPTAQIAMADAEALRGAGLAWVIQLLDELWDAASRDHPIPDDLHARCRLACSHSVSSSITAIEKLCREAGSTANFESSPLPRLLADARAVAGHFMVAPYQMASAGRLLLGLERNDPTF